MEIVTVSFGSKGYSWFCILERRGRNIVGLRWLPGYSRKNEGTWRGPVTIPADRIIGCARPSAPKPVLPDQFEIDALQTRAAAGKAEAKRKLASAAAFAKRLKAGEQIWIEHEVWLKSGDKQKTPLVIRVLGTEGRYLKVRCADYNQGWVFRVLAETAKEVPAPVEGAA